MTTRTFLSLLLLLPWASRARALDAEIPLDARTAGPSIFLAAPMTPIPFTLAPLSPPAFTTKPSLPVLSAAPAAGPAPAAAAAAENPVALSAGLAAAALGALAPMTPAASPDAEIERDARLNALFDGAGEQGVRRIRLVPANGDSAEGLASARAYLATLARAPRLGDARESAAIERRRPLFQLRTRHQASLDPVDPRFLVIRATGRLPKFGAYRYVDLTNGSRFSTTDARGRTRHFVAVRAMREGYSVRADMRTGEISTDKYVSDELLFEMRYDRRANVVSRKFAGPLVLSTSDDILVEHGRFVFEDGRVYSPAPGKLVVSGTVVADFLNKPKTVSTRNAFAELDVNPETGVPRARLDPASGDPAWHYLSPTGSDVKNGMVLSTGRGREVVVFLRLYSPKALDGRVPAGYSLARLSFPSYDDFLRYDSEHALEDLLHPEALDGLDRPHPFRSGVLLASSDLRETYAADPRVTKSGFGPGTKPARVSMRRNGDLYIEEYLGAPAVKLGHIVPDERSGFPLRPGERKWLFLGHQLRHYHDGLHYRDYNAFAYLTDESMGRVERVRGALMSADGALDSGASSLIADLARHNYPMGAEVMENGEYHFSYGASDKHTGAAKLDVLALLREMSDGSPETREGLSYRP
jgi:hypothetical protein